MVWQEGCQVGLLSTNSWISPLKWDSAGPMNIHMDRQGPPPLRLATHVLLLLHIHTNNNTNVSKIDPQKWPVSSHHNLVLINAFKPALNTQSSIGSPTIQEANPISTQLTLHSFNRIPSMSGTYTWRYLWYPRCLKVLSNLIWATRVNLLYTWCRFEACDSTTEHYLVIGMCCWYLQRIRPDM